MKRNTVLFEDVSNYFQLVVGTRQHRKIIIGAGCRQIGIFHLTGINGMKAGAAHQVANDAGNGQGFGLGTAELEDTDGFNAIYLRIGSGFVGIQAVILDDLKGCV